MRVRFTPRARGDLEDILSYIDERQVPPLERGLGKTGRFSVLVSRNWMIAFAWQDIDAIGVDLEDYHG